MPTIRKPLPSTGNWRRERAEDQAGGEGQISGKQSHAALYASCPFASCLSPFISGFLPTAPGLTPPVFYLLLLIGICVIGACAVIAALSRYHKRVQGDLHLEGRMAFVVEALEPEGSVLLDGELWRARLHHDDARITGGQVRVVGARGYWLVVEPVT